jgi:transcription initiation factor TFIIIB Brf1 subunit/transcription initiation factor TFIIB
MQGVQGTWKSGLRRQAAYEGYSVLGKCPECREGLVYAGGERGEKVCSYCGIVVSEADRTVEEGFLPLSVSKKEPLGSYILAHENATVSLNRAKFGWARLNPNILGRETALIQCTMTTDRVAERLSLPKSVAQAANMIARRLLPHKEACEATIASISAYSLLYACRAAGIAHVSYREILRAYTDGGYRIGKSDLLRIGLESGMPLPHPTLEDLVRATVGRLQSSEKVSTRLRKANLDPKEYFTKLLELAKGVAAGTSDLTGFSPRTVAAGSVYVASQSMLVRAFTQREAAETLSMAEYTIREFCCRTKDERMAAAHEVRPVKSGPAPGGHDS